MKRAFEILICGVLLAAIALLCALAWCAIRVEPKAAAALDEVQSIEKSTNDIEQATYASEGEISNLADTLNDIATGLSQHEADELAATDRLSVKLDALIDHADDDMVTLGDTERAATLAVNSTNAAVEKFSEDSHDTLAAGQDALDAAAGQMSNPAIAATLSDIRASAANTAAGTADGAAAVKDVRDVADRFREKILKPVSKAHAALDAIGHFIHALMPPIF